MAKQKYYAVKEGKQTGIFTSWSECEAQVKGYKSAKYKSFPSFEDAEDYLNGTEKELELSYPYAFTDGSYNPATDTPGYGGFLVLADGREFEISGTISDPDAKASHNIASECMGAMKAAALAKRLGLPELTIYYDQKGVELWPTGVWNANTRITKSYADYMRKIIQDVDIRFVKVAAHTGIPGNERADAMAKKAAGIN